MKVISVKFKESGRVYYFDPGTMEIHRGDYVIVETARGTECGEVVRGVHEVSSNGFNKELKPVIRMADGVDVRRMHQNRADERNAYRVCEQRIAAHGLEMKLVEAEYTLDRSKLIFYFTADNRVDFRELVKDLASHFHTRIELRQIGVRDESKMKGGLGMCGQPFCCSRFLKNFQPVSIKMAKEQGLSLNPTKISGACGRLMCCLGYEQKSYEYLNSITPPVGSTVRTPDGEGVVQEVNVISGMLKVRSTVESLAPKYYKREECVYLRGGRRGRKSGEGSKEAAPKENGKETAKEAPKEGGKAPARDSDAKGGKPRETAAEAGNPGPRAGQQPRSAAPEAPVPAAPATEPGEE